MGQAFRELQDASLARWEPSRSAQQCRERAVARERVLAKIVEGWTEATYEPDGAGFERARDSFEHTKKRPR